MEDLLYVKDYYLLVFASEKPENKTDAEWNCGPAFFTCAST